MPNRSEGNSRPACKANFGTVDAPGDNGAMAGITHMVSTGPSKSAKKRDQHALQELGEKLIDLPEDRLRRMPLDEDLFDAIVGASRMKARGALRRQRQLIGKLMRNVDPVPIQAALDAATRTDRQAKAKFRQAEEWRDRIVDGGRPQLSLFLAETEHPNAELDHLVTELSRCRNRNERRILARRIFRVIHGVLNAKVHSTAS